MSTTAGIMTDYATTAPMETFIASTAERHPTDLAGLRGARLVTAIKTEIGRQWAESKIKALTGGDRISARFMRQDFFTFQPIFKLLIAGNHRPGLRSVDEAIRRRLHLIPFNVIIQEEERDRKFPEKLKAEWPGILQWMIDGCLESQKNGLMPPKSVVDATDQYLEAEDAIGTWISECCTTEPGDYATSSELVGRHKSWAERSGEQIGSRKSFSQALLNRGYIAKRQAGTGRAGFQGIAVVKQEIENPWWSQA